MKATEKRFKNFLDLNKTAFVIPVYQRNYSWEKEHCMKLLSDIFDIGNDDQQKEHFIGSIVYILGDPYNNVSIKELSIIDGQQRITTITLIYMRIFKLAQEINDDFLAEDINETYLINKLRRERRLKLKLTENNNPTLNDIYKSENNYDYTQPSRIIENYDYFKKVIQKNNYKEVLKGLEKLSYVEISLDPRHDNPQRIFESLNSTGLDLSQADLIRNYILMGLSIDDQTMIFKNYWQVIENFAKEKGKNQISNFFRDFLTLKYKSIPVISKVYETFKKRYQTVDLDKLSSVLSELKSIVKFYNKLLNPDKENDKDISLQLNYLKKIKITVAYPFLMQVYKDFDDDIIDKQIFILILELIQSYAWRRFILGFGTEGRNKIFMLLYDKVDKNNYLLSVQKALLKLPGTGRFPRNTEVINALREKDIYNIKKQSTRYFLNRLEHYQNNEPVNIDNNSNITIEHIFPQNSDNSGWKTELGKEEYNIIKENYLHTIANLTLSGNNSRLGNKIFIKKRDLENVGYKDSRLWLNKYLGTIEKWGVDEIKERFKIIADRFLKIWTFPKIVIEYENNDEVNIFYAETPKNRKLEYAIFKNEKIIAPSFIALYVKVLKYLFNERKETFLVTDLGKKIGLTNNRKELGRPHEISDTYYIEGGTGNETKFEKLKLALTRFGYEEELTVKYKSQ